MLIVPGPSSQVLAYKVGREAGLRVAELEYKVFPDGESYIRVLTDVKGEDVCVIQSLYPPQDTHFLQLILLIDGLRDLGAKEVHVVIPYMAYARQNMRFLPGECVSALTVLKTIEKLGASSLATIDVHEPEVLRHLSIKARDLSTSELVARYIKEQGLDNPLLVSPDDGWVHRVREVAEMLDLEYTYFVKKRDRVTGEITTFEREVDVDGRDAVIIDDVISTGATMAEAVRLLKKRGARKVLCICTHPLLRGDARLRVYRAGALDLVATDTVPSEISRISVAPVIAKWVRGLP